MNELIPNPGDRIVCVKVGKLQRENMYEMARKYWKVRYERVSRATHVLAITGGKVEAVYIPQSWFLTKNPRYEGRYEFSGEEVFNSPYLGKDVTGFYGRSQNPVKYINL